MGALLEIDGSRTHKWRKGGGNSKIFKVAVSNIFYVHPYLGKWSNLTNIFQRGWNHQLVLVFYVHPCNLGEDFHANLTHHIFSDGGVGSTTNGWWKNWGLLPWFLFFVGILTSWKCSWMDPVPPPCSWFFNLGLGSAAARGCDQKTSSCCSRCVCIFLQVGVSENRGTPKSSILIGCSIINHPFWGTPSFGNTQVEFLPCNLIWRHWPTFSMLQVPKFSFSYRMAWGNNALFSRVRGKGTRYNVCCFRCSERQER